MSVGAEHNHGGSCCLGLNQDLVNRQGDRRKRFNGQTICPERLCKLFKAFLDQIQVRRFHRYRGSDHIHRCPDRDIGGGRFEHIQQEKPGIHGRCQLSGSGNDFCGDRAEINRCKESLHTSGAWNAGACLASEMRPIHSWLMEDLFGHGHDAGSAADLPADAPLAARMRPRNLEEYVGQGHILGEGKLLRRAIEADRLSSVIFYGPPGTGKTSLARVIAGSTKSRFIELSGVEGSVADIRKAVGEAAIAARNGGRTLLFIDEIHRFNKAQQDALLPDVERGTVRLIGATTQNPFFSINSPLVSRSQIFQLQPLGIDDLVGLQRRAVADPERGLGTLPIDLEEDAARHLATVCDGDARKCLNALEIAARTTPFGSDGRIRITLDAASESIQKKAVVYDGSGDDHYDTASAFIKSLRGSDPDAALYWLAKMLHAGEELRFITRRLVIFASEDVGLADPLALPLAISAQQAVEFVGLPEARITLAHATVYLATAPKSNSAYAALGNAQQDLTEGRTLAVPSHLRDSHYKGAKSLGHGEGYKYAHNYEGGYVPQSYLPEGRHYYIPTRHGAEARIADRLEAWRHQFEEAQGNPTTLG